MINYIQVHIHIMMILSLKLLQAGLQKRKGHNFILNLQKNL
jgi:hypothetical protein